MADQNTNTPNTGRGQAATHNDNGENIHGVKPGRLVLAVMRWAARRVDRMPHPGHEEMYGGRTLDDAAFLHGLSPLELLAKWSAWANLSAALYQASGGEVGTPISELTIVVREIARGLLRHESPCEPLIVAMDANGGGRDAD